MGRAEKRICNKNKRRDMVPVFFSFVLLQLREGIRTRSVFGQSRRWIHANFQSTTRCILEDTTLPFRHRR